MSVVRFGEKLTIPHCIPFLKIKDFFRLKACYMTTQNTASDLSHIYLDFNIHLQITTVNFIRNKTRNPSFKRGSAQ